jgi:hypothetical protein
LTMIKRHGEITVVMLRIRKKASGDEADSYMYKRGEGMDFNQRIEQVCPINTVRKKK